MNQDPQGAAVLEGVLGTSGLVDTNASAHLGSYSDSVRNIPGIVEYFGTKYGLERPI